MGASVTGAGPLTALGAVQNVADCLGLSVARCKACDKAIFWARHDKRGSKIPIDAATGQNHFAQCSDPDRFRRQKG